MTGPKRRIRAGAPNRAVAAVLEVALIFLGITLAIGFENWNSERAERADERELLAELRVDLTANIEVLQTGLTFNRLTLARIDSVLDHLDERLPYSSELSSSLSTLENWASPYLSRSAYETLMSRGVSLIREPSLRSGIVRLYENVYTNLVSDGDRAEWVNYEVSMIPLMLRVIEERPGQLAEPIDYEALLDDRAFRTALLRTKSLRHGTIESSELAIEATNRVLAMIEASSPPVVE